MARIEQGNWKGLYLAIERHLTDKNGDLPQLVSDWVQWPENEFHHARLLDESLAWAEQILRFESVRRSLRQDDQFWEAYCQLRLACWLDFCGLRCMEFEPITVGKKRADFRSEIAGFELDAEVTSPRPGASEVRNVRSPIKWLKDALKDAEIEGISVYVEHEGQASFEDLTQEAAERVALDLASRLAAQPLGRHEERIFEFPCVTVTYVKIDGLPAHVQPADGPLRLRVRGIRGMGLLFSSSIDLVAYAKPTRPAGPGSTEQANWAMSTLIEKAEQLSPERLNGIWIEGTRDNNVLLDIVSPWGMTKAIDQFWDQSESHHVDFVALFELSPGHPQILPGVRGMMTEPIFNPRGRLVGNEAAFGELKRAWANWSAHLRATS